MDDRRKAVVGRKRGVLKGQITGLVKAAAKQNTRVNLELRLKNVETLFTEYIGLHGELEEAFPNDPGVSEFETIQDNFYEVAAKINSMPTPSLHSDPGLNWSLASNRIGNSTVMERQKTIKLPVAELPKFDGDLNKWLSFKNTFDSMIDSRSDIDDLNKFLYLKNSLTGAAAGKLSHYVASAENYKAAREMLVKSYEKKRILVTKHIDAIYDIAPLKTATSAGLAKLIDDARQHITMLDSLGVKAGQSNDDSTCNSYYALIIRWLERILPINVRREWEKTLTLDELPTFEQFCDFVTDFSFRISALDQENSRERGEPFKKRHFEQTHNSHKYKRNEIGARSLVTATNSSRSQPRCILCQQAHELWHCSTYKNLPVKQRWEVVRKNKMCQNCLRVHSQPCAAGHCKYCPKQHNSLLHSSEKKSAPPKVGPQNNSPS